MDRLSDAILRFIGNQEQPGRPAAAAADDSGPGRLTSLAVMAILATFLLRLLNAVLHPGFVTGDDVELHEMTFKALFGGTWPIWEIRSPVYPMVFLYPVQALTATLGSSDTEVLVLATRVTGVVISTLTPVLLYALAYRLTRNHPVSAIAVLLFVTSRLHLWFGSSEFPRPVAAVFVLAAFYLLAADTAWWRPWLAGVCIGAAGALRFSEFVVLIPAACQLLIEGRRKASAAVLISGAAVGLGILAAGDWLYWGSPLSSAGRIVDFTLIRGESSRGFQPPWFYLSHAQEWTTAVVAALSLASFASEERRPAAWAWTTIALLSLLPHKEARYVIPVQPLVCLSAAIALGTVVRRWPLHLRSAMVMLVVFATAFELSSWHVRRSDDEVQVARAIRAELDPDSIAAPQMWRFGGRLYWREMNPLIPIPDEGLDAVPEVDVVVLARENTSEHEGRLLKNAGFVLSDLSTRPYLVFTRGRGRQ